MADLSHFLFSTLDVAGKAGQPGRRFPMDDPVEHRRLTLVALRILGDVMACITVPVALFASVAHRAGGGFLYIAAIGAAFVISMVTLSLRAVKYNQWYLK